MDNTANTEPQTAAEIADAPETTAENREIVAAVPTTAATPEPTAPRRTTRQFDLGDGRRLVDMRTTSGGVEIIPEAPGVNFDGLPTMTEREAILAAFHIEGSDEQKFALIRQIAAATH